MISRRRLLTAAGAYALSLAHGPARAEPRAVFEGPAMGTGYRVVVPGLAAADRAVAAAAVRHALADVDARMSPFRRGSELTRFNALDAGAALAVSRPTRLVCAEALAVAELTGGAFDPVAGARAAAWGFGATPPPRGTHRDVRLDTAAGTIAKARPGAVLDLCGIAKGFALDRVAEALGALGVARCLIEVGGEVLAVGGGWRVAVERPDAPPGRAQAVVRLDDAAIATSGDGAQSFTWAGRRYATVVDPKTGAPADHGTAAVSVVAPTAMRADALATALMAMAPLDAIAFAEDRRLAALVLTRGPGGLVETATAAFARRRAG